MRLFTLLQEYISYQKLSVKEATVKRELCDLRLLILYLRNPLLPAVTDQDIIGYLNTMKEMGWEHNALVKRSVHFRKFWEWLNKKEYPTFNHALLPVMKIEWKQKRIVTEEHYQKIISVIPNKGREAHIRNAAMIRMLWDTGCRAGELIAIKENDVDIVNMKAIVKTEKSRGKRPFRHVFWTKETNEYLKLWLKKKHQSENERGIKDKEYLFWGSHTNGGGVKLQPQTVNRVINLYCAKAKVQPINPHAFRHHFGHDLAKKGANNSIISSLMGHSQLSSSFVYTELNDTEREEMYAKYNRKDIEN